MNKENIGITSSKSYAEYFGKILIIRIIQAEKTGKVYDVAYVDGVILVKGDWNTLCLYVLHMKKS